MLKQPVPLRVVIKRPGEPAQNASVLSTLEAAQAVVEGFIDVVRVADGVDLVVNDEGLLQRLAHNFIVVGDCGPIPIVGPAFFVAVDDAGDFRSLSDDQVAVIASRWLFDDVFIAPHIDIDLEG